MARLWMSGFEQNSTASNMEWTSTNGSPTIQTGTVHSGTYAGQVNSLVSGTKKGFKYNIKSAVNTGPFFYRCWYNFATLPTAENAIMTVNAGGTFSSTIAAMITIDNTGALRLYNGSSTTIGSASSAITTNAWHYIELWFDRSPAGGSEVIKGRVDGVEFASSSSLTIANSVEAFIVGMNLNGETQVTGNVYLDDCAVNDGTGGSQNSYPGNGQIVDLLPNAQGDNNAWSVQVGGTAGSANNYTRVNEVTPDDSTSYNADTVSGDIDDYKCNATPSSIGSSDTINCVGISVRLSAAVAVSEATFVVRCKKTSGGTVSEGSTVAPISTTWFTNNGNPPPQTFTLMLYLDPDGNPWTKSTLDTMQIGMRINATNTNAAQVSNIRAVIDSTPVTLVNKGGTMHPMGVG